MKFKTETNNLFLVLIYCLLALAATEIILRIHNPFQFRVKADKVNLPVYYHYKFELTNVKQLDKIVSHTKNSLGFRGEEPPKNFEKHLTIITVGGSETESFVINDGKTWPALLGEKAKESFKHVWLNNAGRDGLSTYGYTILMENYIHKIKPKVVLFLVGLGDQISKDDRRFDQLLTNDLALNFDSIKGFLRTAGNYSEVFTLALNLYRYTKKIPFPHTSGLEKDLKKIETLEIEKNKELKIIDKKLKEFKEKYENGYSSRLKNLIKVSRENNIEPVLLTSPTLYGDTIDEITNVNLGKIKITNGENGNIAWENLEFFNDVTRAIGSDRNVLVIDLANEMPKSSRYFYDLTHFNNEGSEKISEIVYNKLKPFLKKSYGNYSKNIN
jgi:lysophospholipase L1-like esterase